MASRTCARASARSREPFGSPPITRMRHCAPIAAASSMARRLSSSAARRPASSDAGNIPPRQSPVTVMPCVRMSLPARSTPQACTMSRQGEIAVMPARAQPSISCSNDHAFTVIELIESHERSFGQITHHALSHAHSLRSLPSRALASGGEGWGGEFLAQNSPPTPDPSPPLRVAGHGEGNTGRMRIRRITPPRHASP